MKQDTESRYDEDPRWSNWLKIVNLLRLPFFTLFTLCLLWRLTHCLSLLLRPLVGFVYPGFLTFKCIRNKSAKKEQLKWLMYWSSYAAFSSMEYFFDPILLFWLPLYHELKIAALVVLLWPLPDGSQGKCANSICLSVHCFDQKVDFFVASGINLCTMSLGGAAFQNIAIWVFNTASKFGHNVVESIKLANAATQEHHWSFSHQIQPSIGRAIEIEEQSDADDDLLENRRIDKHGASKVRSCDMQSSASEFSSAEEVTYDDSDDSLGCRPLHLADHQPSLERDIRPRMDRNGNIVGQTEAKQWQSMRHLNYQTEDIYSNRRPSRRDQAKLHDSFDEVQSFPGHRQSMPRLYNQEKTAHRNDWQLSSRRTFVDSMKNKYEAMSYRDRHYSLPSDVDDDEFEDYDVSKNPFVRRVVRKGYPAPRPPPMSRGQERSYAMSSFLHDDMAGMACSVSRDRDVVDVRSCIEPVHRSGTGRQARQGGNVRRRRWITDPRVMMRSVLE